VSFVSSVSAHHCSSPPGGSQQHSLARWIIHPIVVALRKNHFQNAVTSKFKQSLRSIKAGIAEALDQALSRTICITLSVNALA
jgi:hypothetical protein